MKKVAFLVRKIHGGDRKGVSQNHVYQGDE